ncbi:hypothetical protein SAY87_024933 [Trapa incisa]|uniref:Chalcone-flavanone isomerase family protein n=1 Tax=Trapa incisa TaxID=236973 RepID=A0AAN7GF49_9MYRT|nr:hypothetical protein SAY87_024933 [Trapa incisa]
MGSLLTPSSSMAKKRSERRKPMTPGSGEALLRGQVKTLLQKVEEEAEISKISLKNRPIFPYDQGFVSSPMGLLLAPTPANTPQVLSLSGAESETNSVNSVVSSLNPDKRVSIPQVVEEILDGRMPEESTESQKSLITRSLLLDFSEKSEISSQCSSALTQTEGDNGDSKEKFSADEENSSIWSIQVNASSRDEDFEEAEVDDEFEEDNYEEEYSGEGEEEEEDEGHGESLEELCLGLGSMSILEAKFEGKHTRFVYNSDDEMVEGVGEGDLVSPGIVRLKGMPTPKGKHLRFPAVEDEDKKEAC